MSIFQGYRIPLHKTPIQGKPLNQTSMSRVQKLLVDQEIAEMLKKGAILNVNHVNGEFLSNLFLVPKKDEGNRPVINLKKINKFMAQL